VSLPSYRSHTAANSTPGTVNADLML